MTTIDKTAERRSDIPTKDELRTWHRPSEHVDYVAIPPIRETVCLECQIGDGFQKWPCDVAVALDMIDA